MYYVIVCIYVSKCKWYMYLYVNKHVELAQQKIAVLKMYVLLFLLLKGEAVAER